MENNVFLSSSTQNHAESFRNFIKKQVLGFKYEVTRNVRNWTKSLVSGIWFLSPEAGGTLSRDPGEPCRAARSHSALRRSIRTL